MNKTLLMIIGIPGSGKSTMAEKIKKENPEYSNSNIWEADMFFVNPKNGEYNWNVERLASAHRWCQIQVENDMRDGKNVIVSNTNLRPRERKPYIDLAKKYGYKVEVITCDGGFKNIHNVPEETIERMKQKFVPYSEDEIKN